MTVSIFSVEESLRFAALHVVVKARLLVWEVGLWVNLVENCKKSHIFIVKYWHHLYQSITNRTIGFRLNLGYLEFCCVSRSLGTFSQMLPLCKLIPGGEVLSVFATMVPAGTPLLIFVIKWSAPGAADPGVWLWTLLGVCERVWGADSIQCSELGVWASNRPPQVCCYKL